MYHVDKCMILKVMDRFFHHYFICSKLKKNVSSLKALLLRHVHVPVHVLIYMYMYRYLYMHSWTLLNQILTALNANR
jgi:hypothetical protein